MCCRIGQRYSQPMVELFRIQVLLILILFNFWVMDNLSKSTEITTQPKDIWENKLLFLLLKIQFLNNATFYDLNRPL